VVVTDSDGNFLFDVTLSSHNNGGCKNVMLDAAGDLLVVGESATDSSAQFDIIVGKVDLNAQQLKWLRYIHGSNESDAGFSIMTYGNENYLIAGYGYDTSSGMKKIVLCYTDSSLNPIDTKYFGQSSVNIGFDLKPSVSGGHFIAGTDYINNQFVLVYERELPDNATSYDGKVNNFIYPSVFSSGSEICFSKKSDRISVSDLSGKIIFTMENPPVCCVFPILTRGIYLIKSESGRNQTVSRIIVL
jgi:hypothetical protein